MTADTVVFFPRRTLALISPIRSLSPGCTAFSRLDLPAPDGPVTTEIRPGQCGGKGVDAFAGLGTGGIDGVAGRAAAVDQRRGPGSSSILLTTTAA